MAKKFWETLLDEYESLKGERDAMKKADKAEWWKEIDWAADDSRTVFDALPEETRNLIIEAGMCPECMDAKRTEAERAMSHFSITPEDWAKLSDEEKQGYIKKLPPRGSGEKDEECEEGYEKNEEGECVPVKKEEEEEKDKASTEEETPPITEKKKKDAPDPYEVLRRADALLAKKQPLFTHK